MDWVVFIRTFNAVGCLTALIFLLRAAFHQWKSWNFKTQQHWLALVGWVSLGLEGTIETYFLNIPAGPRTVLTTLVVAWTARALLINDDLNAKAPLSRKEKT